MKKWTVLSCSLLVAGSCMSTMAVAQTISPVPAGTALMVKLDTTLATFSNKAGDPFRARLAEPVMLNGRVVIPAGAMVEGRVTRAVSYTHLTSIASGVSKSAKTAITRCCSKTEPNFA